MAKTDPLPDFNTVFHRLRYFLIACIISFLMLSTMVGFNYRQSLRNSETPRLNTHLLCSAIQEIIEATGEGDLPGECTPEVLNDHSDHGDGL